jgi:hypothetical protein
MDELTRTTTEIKSMLAALDQKFDKRFDVLEDRMEVRFGAVDARFVAMEARFTGIEGRFAGVEGRFTGVEGRFTAVEARFNQWFLSILALQVTTLLAIVAGLFGIITKLM